MESDLDESCTTSPHPASSGAKRKKLDLGIDDSDAAGLLNANLTNNNNIVIVTRAEYITLKRAVEGMKEEVDAIKRSLFDGFKQSMCRELALLRKDNMGLRQEVQSLRDGAKQSNGHLQNKPVLIACGSAESEQQDRGESLSNGGGSVMANMQLACEYVFTLEKANQDLSQKYRKLQDEVVASQAVGKHPYPVPSAESAAFLQSLASYYAPLAACDIPPQSDLENRAARLDPPKVYPSRKQGAGSSCGGTLPPGADSPFAVGRGLSAAGGRTLCGSPIFTLSADGGLNGVVGSGPQERVVKQGAPSPVSPVLLVSSGARGVESTSCCPPPAAGDGEFCCGCHPRSSGTCMRCHGPGGKCTNCRNRKCRFKAQTKTPKSSPLVREWSANQLPGSYTALDATPGEQETNTVAMVTGTLPTTAYIRNLLRVKQEEDCSNEGGQCPPDCCDVTSEEGQDSNSTDTDVKPNGDVPQV